MSLGFGVQVRMEKQIGEYRRERKEHKNEGKESGVSRRRKEVRSSTNTNICLPIFSFPHLLNGAASRRR